MSDAAGRDLTALPKAHLHLHLTGSMRRSTVTELAAEAGIRLPRALTDPEHADLRVTGGRTWWHFQRVYDLARAVLRRPEHVHRILRELLADEAAEGSGWVELQVDPSGYATRFGGLVPAMELFVDALAAARRTQPQVGAALVVAANRTRSPHDAATLARLAVRFRDRGVVGFGLSNDERAAPAAAFAGAFRIARRAGLLAVPHGGEFGGPEGVAACLDVLGADRIGHGIRAAGDPGLLHRLAATGVTLEVCPTSNVGMGVVMNIESLPLRELREAGVGVALSADDPLLFGSRLVGQYDAVRRAHALADADLAGYAEASVAASAAPDALKHRLQEGIRTWVAADTAAARDDNPG